MFPLFLSIKISMKIFAIALCLVSCVAYAQHPVLPNAKEPWTADQLLAPDKLAAALNDTKVAPPIIISVSPGPVIPGSIDIGPTSEKSNVEKLKKQLKSIPTDSDVVIYCGCCPFDRCPNIRPAFNLLNEMGFRNHKLLNLPNNVKIDWINKGYPVVKLK
jgi:thiosulfate/3-mercaptopyruvate sulfurtransferase